MTLEAFSNKKAAFAEANQNKENPIIQTCLQELEILEKYLTEMMDVVPPEDGNELGILNETSLKALNIYKKLFNSLNGLVGIEHAQVGSDLINVLNLSQPIFEDILTQIGKAESIPKKIIVHPLPSSYILSQPIETKQSHKPKSLFSKELTADSTKEYKKISQIISMWHQEFKAHEQVKIYLASMSEQIDKSYKKLKETEDNKDKEWILFVNTLSDFKDQNNDLIHLLEFIKSIDTWFNNPKSGVIPQEDREAILSPLKPPAPPQNCYINIYEKLSNFSIKYEKDPTFKKMLKDYEDQYYSYKNIELKSQRVRW